MTKNANANKAKRHRVPAWLERDTDWRAVGGLSLPSKMPGFAYGLPAADCVTGTKLRGVKGSTCSACYAFGRGNYKYANVVGAQKRRLRTLGDLDAWTAAMIRLIAKLQRVKFWEPVFRWHDSGDLQSVAHLTAIVAIANALPEVRFWIPTREYAMVRDFLQNGGILPSNLTVRMSAMLVGRPTALSDEVRAQNVASSTVGAADGFECEASTRNNECGPCRACWTKTPNVDYPLHSVPRKAYPQSKRFSSHARKAAA